MSTKTFKIDTPLLALLVGLVAIVVIFVPLVILLMGVFAFAIGLIYFLGNRNDIVALIAMIIGIIVIVVAIWQNM
jgi:hypothetical protein